MIILDALNAGQLFGRKRPAKEGDLTGLQAGRIDPPVARLQNRHRKPFGFSPVQRSGGLLLIFRPVAALLVFFKPGHERSLFRAFTFTAKGAALPQQPQAQFTPNDHKKFQLPNLFSGLASSAKALSSQAQLPVKTMQKEIQKAAETLQSSGVQFIRQAKAKSIELCQKTRAAMPEDAPAIRMLDQGIERMKLLIETGTSQYREWMQQDGMPQKMTQALLDWIVHGDLPRPVLDMIAWFQQITPYLLPFAYAHHGRWKDQGRKKRHETCARCKRQECECEDER